MRKPAKILDSGRPLTARRLSKIEEDMGIELSEEHRKFLLRYNGGKPRPALFWVGGESNAYDELESFYGIGGDFDLPLAYSYTKDLIGTLAVPIGSTGCGDQLIQFLRGPGAGEIWFLDHEEHGELEFVAKSFPDLLRSFRSK